MTFEDLKGALILISYAAVSTDDIDHTIDLDTRERSAFFRWVTGRI